MSSIRTQPIILLVVWSCVISVVSAQCPWVGVTDKWSTAPISGQSIVIGNGVKKLLDVSLSVYSIEIQSGGELVLDNAASLNLRMFFLKVDSGGKLTAGSPSCPLTGTVTITLLGTRTATDLIGNGFGSKGIYVADGGQMDLHGVQPVNTWTTISATVNPGDTVLQLTDDVSDWKPGQKIALASTDYDQLQTEYLIIQSVTSNTITVTTPIVYLHWGQDYEHAEVGLLSRNVILQGNNTDTDTDGFGGHLVCRRALCRFTGIEVTKMGQKGVLGRYPLHFHLADDISGWGAFIKGCAVHHNYQRCITIHDSSGILVQDNVAYWTIGHCYFMEDGPEMKSTYQHNLGMVANAGSLIPSDTTPSIFWITNPNNTWIGNAAVGGFHGIWFAMPERPTGPLSTPKYAASTTMWPRQIPLGYFKDNTVHSCSNTGLHIDDMENTDLTTSLGNYQPRLPPYSEAWRGDFVIATFDGTVSYKNQGHGIWMRGGPGFHIINAKLMDNVEGVQLVGGDHLVENSLIIGETTNPGTPRKPTEWTNLPENGRRRPYNWDVGHRIAGFEVYDFGGPQYVRNVEFRNFQTDMTRPAGAVGGLYNSKNMHGTVNKFEKVTLTNSNPVYWETFWGTTDQLMDGPKSRNVLDSDGSLTGLMGGWVVANNPFMIQDRTDCQFKSEWNAYLCPPTFEGWAQIIVKLQDMNAVNYNGLIIDQTRPWSRAIIWPFGNRTPYINETGEDWGNVLREMFWANNVPRRGYAITFPHPTPDNITLAINNAAFGDWAVIAVPYPNTWFHLTKTWSNTPMSAASSLAGLDKDHYWYDSVNKWLYVYVFQEQSMAEYTTTYQFTSPSQEAFVTVSAGCGLNCVVTPGPIPSALAVNEDQYKANLQGCQANTDSQSWGDGFFHYSPTSNTLSYYIYHNLPYDTVQNAYIRRVSDDAVIAQLTNAYAPIRGALNLGRDQQLSLFSGGLYVHITTYAHPDGEVKGIIGCSPDSMGNSMSSCSAIPAGPSAPACSPVGATQDLLVEQKPATLGDWSWPAGAYNFSYNVDCLCGSYCTLAKMGAWSGMKLHASTAFNVPANMVYLQFYIRQLPSANSNPTVGFQPAVITVNGEFGNGTPWSANGVDVSLAHVYNLAILDTWTRVRIPLSQLGFPSPATSPTSVLEVQITTHQNGYLFVIDQMQWLGDPTGEPTPSITAQRYDLQSVCVGPEDNGLSSAADFVRPVVSFALFCVFFVFSVL